MSDERKPAVTTRCAHCNGIMPYPIRADAIYCRAACRVNAHRAAARAARARSAAADEAARQTAAIAQHRDRWLAYLSKHLPANSRPSRTTVEQLYDRLLRDGMIEPPWVQGTLPYGRGRR